MEAQALEVGIGLVLAFLVVSTIASAVVELIGALLQKRSKDLEAVINTMLSDGQIPQSLDLYTTSIFRALKSAAGRARRVGGSAGSNEGKPSYVSARSFADAVIERLSAIKKDLAAGQQLVDALPPGPLRDRLLALSAETTGDLTRIKSGLEAWFDDTMDRLQGAYRRWSQWWLLLVGLIIAAAFNVSTVRIVDSLWNDSTLRDAVASAAEGYAQRQTDGATPADFAAIEEAVDELTDLDLPIGWGAGWDAESGWLPTVIGLPMTALAVMLGAPFWYDLLTKLLGLVKTRGEPPRAADDPASATSLVTQTAPAVAAAAAAPTAADAAAAAPAPPAADATTLLHDAVP